MFSALLAILLKSANYIATAFLKDLKQYPIGGFQSICAAVKLLFWNDSCCAKLAIDCMSAKANHVTAKARKSVNSDVSNFGIYGLCVISPITYRKQKHLVFLYCLLYCGH